MLSMTEITNYHLRPAVAADAPRLADLVREGMPGYPFESVYDPGALARDISAGETRVVAEITPDLPLLGTAVLGVNPAESMSEIKRVVVDPSARKNGVAKRLVEYLTHEAFQDDLIPWADVRSNQIGMQRSAAAVGMHAVSLEPGKHVVYRHPEPDGDLGPARETMIHMTSLDLPLGHLVHALSSWSNDLQSELIENLSASLSPEPKDPQLALRLLPNAAQVKDRISTRLSHLDVQEIGPDLTLVTAGAGQMLVISPDASGFITQPRNLPELVHLADSGGLQLVTCYNPAADSAVASDLAAAGFTPAMIRPWQPDPASPPRWEVGWRRPANNYASCLHPINLDPAIAAQITGVISQLKSGLAGVK